jgi:hypothetical protein
MQGLDDNEHLGHTGQGRWRGDEDPSIRPANSPVIARVGVELRLLTGAPSHLSVASPA